MPSTKHITDMTDEEILALTEDDIKRMIQLRMLEEGVKILQAPEQPQYAEVPAKDQIGYRIKISHSTIDEITFSHRDAAERVAAAIRAPSAEIRHCTYMSGASYERTLDEYEELPEVTVEEARFYSRPLYLKVKESLEGNKRLKEAYEKQLGEYREAESARIELRDEIENRYYAVTRKYREFESMLMRFNEYLALADNDAAKATIFFDKAYKPDPETQKYLSEKTDGKYKLAVGADPEQPQDSESDDE